MSIFGLGGNASIEIILDNIASRKSVTIKEKDDTTINLPLYKGEDDISGRVEVNIGKSKKLEHMGIRIELIGRIESYADSKQSSDFVSMGKELLSAGCLTEDTSFKFSFNNFEKQYETYNGLGVKLRYFIRVTINRQYAPNIVKEKDFAVHVQGIEPKLIRDIKMEVGIEGCLHIEFEYNKKAFHQTDCIIGQVFFRLIDMKIVKMDLELVKKELYGTDPEGPSQESSIAQFEVMDGCPSRGEIIPIRLYLKTFNLTPTFTNVNNRFSVMYFLNLVLVDETNRRYFKRQEIIIWRKK